MGDLKKVDCLAAFYEARELGETSMAEVKRNTYKYTECGAWCETVTDEWGDVIGLRLGSIVEGSDACTESYTLEFPFYVNEFWVSLDQIEEEAEYLWQEANSE